MDYQKQSTFLKAIAEPNRLEIVDLLSCGEMCVYDILEHFDFTQPTLSYHLKVLQEERIVTMTKREQRNYYSLNEEFVNTFMGSIFIIFSDDPTTCVCGHTFSDKEQERVHGEIFTK